MLDPVTIRWESLAVVAGALALGAWSLRSLQPAPEPKGSEAPAKLVLEVFRPGREAETIAVEDGCRIGRGRDCAIALDDSAVSKWHARLHFDGRRASVEDLDSTNGTLVNGRRIEGGATVQLRRGDEIAAGAHRMIFVSVSRASERSET